MKTPEDYRKEAEAIKPDFSLEWGVWKGLEVGYEYKLLTTLSSDHLENILVTQPACSPVMIRTILEILKERLPHGKGGQGIVVGGYQFTKQDEHRSTSHSSFGGTYSWNQKILEAGLNGVEFEVVLRPKKD